ncbi:MAG: ATP-binding protein [Phycisphaerales bacterium]|nr:ATP-binding protein [Phycisphaerales bacterium]
MSKVRSASLIWKVGIPTTLVVMVLGIATSLIVATQSREQLTIQAESRLDSVLAMIHRQVTNGVPMSRLEVPRDIRFTVISAGGKALLDSDQPVEDMDTNLLYRPEVQDAMKATTGFSKRYSTTLGREMIYVARQSEMPGTGPILLRVSLDAGPVVSPSLNYLTIVIAATIAIVIVLLIGLYLLQSGLRRELDLIAGIIPKLDDQTSTTMARRISTRNVSRELAGLVHRVKRLSKKLHSRMNNLENAQSETQGILASMSNGVIAMGADRRILTMNPAAARMFRLLGKDVRGRLLEEIVRDPSLLNAIDEGMKEGRMRFQELELESLGGRTMEIAIEPLYASDSMNMTGVLVMLNETTRLRKLERMRKDFAANVSHELRTPLTSIRGYVELLDQSVHDEDGRNRLKIIERNAVRLSAIIEDLLTLSRLESGDESSMELRFDSIRVADLLQGVASLCEDQARSSQMEIRIDLDDQLLELEGNHHLLEQALINLLENAIRYSDSGSPIVLRGHQTMDEVELSVIDTGSGIPADHLPRLFERFYRVDSGRSRDKGGTGLGLAIVKHIALIHGGVAGVESKPGFGSTFFITLPGSSPSNP